MSGYRYVRLDGPDARQDECVISTTCTTDGTPCGLCGGTLDHGCSMYACVGCGQATHEWCSVLIGLHVCAARRGETIGTDTDEARRARAIAWGVQAVFWMMATDPTWMIERANGLRNVETES